MVVPLVGTWIEIMIRSTESSEYSVVPLVGTWIEIIPFPIFCPKVMSSPSWGRGLKFR